MKNRWIALAVLGIAFVVFAAPAEEKDDATYNTLIQKGMNRDLAALMTPKTEIIAEDNQQLHYTQTMIGGGKRDVTVTFTPMQKPKGAAVPMALEDGSVILTERASIASKADGYTVHMSYFIPAKSLTPEMAQAFGLNQRKHFTLSDLLGIQSAWAEGGSSGMSVGFSDSSSGVSMQSISQEASRNANDLTYEGLKTAREVYEVIGKAQGAESSTAVDAAKGAAKVMDQITKVMKIKKETNAMLEKLRALRKCHQNPTNKLAKDAIKNDPKAYDAVEKDLNARELEISLNGATRIVSTTVNNSAGVYLGKAVKVVGPVISKATSSLDKVEDTILKELAKETMKGAEKGIVPCDCDPVYTPLPPSEELASYPPASLSCEPKPEELVCQAAPPDSASKNFTPGPPPKLKSADVCVVLTHAQFTYTDSKQSSGCNAMGCGSREENTFYTGSATLKPVEGGYEGDGQGTYRHTGSSDDHLNIPRCNTENRIWWTEGAGGLKVNVQSSINNDVTGGIDTSGMSEDTSVAEIITNGDRLHDEEHTYTACEDPKDEAIDTQVIGFDCHFYGVDLHRPGFYQTYKDREPGSGICTLTLSQ